jgi:hypothetical protein
VASAILCAFKKVERLLQTRIAVHRALRDRLDRRADLLLFTATGRCLALGHEPPDQGFYGFRIQADSHRPVENICVAARINILLGRSKGRAPLFMNTLLLWWKHDIKQPLPNRQQAGAHLVGLIRGNLRKGVVDAVDQTLGTRFLDLELCLEVAFDVKRPHREIGPTAAAAAQGIGVAASQT